MIIKVAAMALIGILYTSTAQATSLKTGGGIFPPLGFIKFCAKNKSECTLERFSDTRKEVDLDSASWEKISAVHKQVNASIIPAHDIDIHGFMDHWSFAETGYGDCEDYALVKRNALLKKGFPPSALLLTTTITEQGERHVVLSVITNMGDIVLDNRFDKPRFLDSLDYYWLARQDPDNLMRWLAVKDQSKPQMVRAPLPFETYLSQ